MGIPLVFITSIHPFRFIYMQGYPLYISDTPSAVYIRNPRRLSFLPCTVTDVPMGTSVVCLFPICQTYKSIQPGKGKIRYDKRISHMQAIPTLQPAFPMLCILRAELVPTAWWHRDFSRLRLDAHHTGNKQCTHNWGVSTVVRLPRL